MSIFKLSLRNRGLTSPAPLIGLGVAISLIVISAWMLGAATTAATAQAVPTRIGVVDFQKILTESAPGKASVARLTALQNDRMTRAKALNDEMRKLDNDLKNPALTPAQRNPLQARMAEKQIAIKRFAEDADKEIGTARDRELVALQTRLKPVIDAVGREMSMAAIFNKLESGLIYANDAIDLTNAVIVRFNATPNPPTTTRD
jgi:outer membrane protein